MVIHVKALKLMDTATFLMNAATPEKNRFPNFTSGKTS